MKISELIDALKEIKNKRGDLDVYSDEHYFNKEDDYCKTSKIQSVKVDYATFRFGEFAEEGESIIDEKELAVILGYKKECGLERRMSKTTKNNEWIEL